MTSKLLGLAFGAAVVGAAKADDVHLRNDSSPIPPLEADSKEQAADQRLEEIRKKHKLPGLAVVVVRNGVICERAAAGVRKHGDPTLLTTHDLFHIGSCTKSMTATLAAKLIENGKLRWDSTIVDAFPELRAKMDPAYQKVTIEQLLMHRGGIPAKAPVWGVLKAYTEEGSPTQQRYEFIQKVLAKPPQVPPGTKWIYSNQGYVIAGAMLEKLTGSPWETLMTDHLFRPLGLNSAGFGQPGTAGKLDQPWGHTRMLGMIRASQDDPLPVALGPAGSVHCSLEDLARYSMFHMEGENRDGLLEKDTVRKLHTPPEGGDYACGWGCSKNPAVKGAVLTHGGSNGEWYVSMCLVPDDDFAILVGTNIAGKGAEEAVVEISREMFKRWLPGNR